MKKVSVRELHEHTGAIVSEAAQGKVIVVEKRGEAVAELRPMNPFHRISKFPNRDALLARFPKVKDSGRYLEKHR